ncbi:uncharacterized protein LOC109718167 isoform X2 [Ananas comosus]|uniref:Uncharacterized protein LOC109718167 isoform X2 n=1 Tax=Ananas comosus TaxID=4615 RepID=A0A6P5FUZ4_ANACO|nr:uncharacterized protein LOC109718167 isoform X2 [Ananas comosus]
MKPSLAPLPPPYSSLSSPAAAAAAAAAPSAVAVESPSFTQPYYPHLRPHHAAAPAQPPPMVHADPEMQRISTLFVAGLPDDVKPREIHNLFRRRRGFDSCQLEYTGRGNQVIAFATFFTHHAAMAAMDALNGVVFDPETGSTLHIELARSNSRKRPQGGGAYIVIDKRVKAKKDDQDESSNDGDVGSGESSDTENDNSSNKGALSPEKSSTDRAKQDHERATAKEKSEKPSTADIPPCSTLFIANLGTTCTKEELEEVLTKHSGYYMLKMRRRGGMPVAFADFEDVESSSAAMKSLQGTLLPTSDRGGLHLEYARSKMRI